MGSETAKPTRLEDGGELDAFVERRTVALVEFYTKGCSKCQAMEPVLGNVARATPIAVGMVNPGDDIGLVERFDIRSVPTLVLFRNGEPIAQRASGFLGGDEIVDFVETHVPEISDE